MASAAGEKAQARGIAVDRTHGALRRSTPSSMAWGRTRCAAMTTCVLSNTTTAALVHRAPESWFSRSHGRVWMGTRTCGRSGTRMLA